MAEVDLAGVSLRTWFLLASVDYSKNIVEIAEATSITYSHINRIIRSLIGQGFLISHKEGREMKLQLTSAGAEFFAQILKMKQLLETVDLRDNERISDMVEESVIV